MNIAVKNFKVFEKYQNFEIRPLTLIVGPNNTGKSALAKLLQLLKHGTFKLDFKNSGLNSFEDIVNWNHQDKGFQFNFPAYTSYLPYLDATINYNDGCCNFLELTAEVEDDIISVLEIQKTENCDFHLFFNYKWLLDCFYNDELYYKNTRLNSTTPDTSISEFKPLPSYKHVSEILNIKDKETLFPGVSANKHTEEIFKKQLDYLYSKDNNLKSLSEVYDSKFYTILPLFSLVDNTLQKLNQNTYCLFDVFEGSENQTKLYEEKIIEIQDDVFGNLNINLTDDFIDGETIANTIKEEIMNRFLQITMGLNVTLIENEFFKLIFENKMLQTDYRTQNNKYSVWSELLNQLFFLKENLKRLHLSSVKRDISEEYVRNLYDSLESLKSYRKNHFLNIIRGILQKFDLKDIEICKTVIWITDENERKIDIRNLGYGYSKLVPLILGLIELSIVDVYSLYKDIFIIEEPESNLHPDFQSRLAEIFTIVSKYFLSVNLIVETHSEYLIRNLQYIIADGRADRRNSVIYYFNKDKFVSNSNPKVKRITIDSNGQLSSGFGSGFYDEAIKLQFAISQLPYNNN